MTDVLSFLESEAKKQADKKSCHEFDVELIRLIRKVLPIENSSDALESGAIILMSILAMNNPQTFVRKADNWVTLATIGGLALNMLQRRKD